MEKLDDADAGIKLWHVYLKFTNVRDQDLQAVCQDLKKEIFIDEKYPTNVVQLAKLLRRLDELDLAVKYYQVALEDPIISCNHEYLTTIYTDLALVYRLKKDYKRALGFYEDAENSAKHLSIKPYDRPFRMITGNKALVFKYLKQYDQALECTLQVLSMDNQAEIQDTQEHATTLNNVATLYVALGLPQDAIKYFTHVLNIQERTLSTNHPEIARTYNNMSSCYNAIGNSVEAENVKVKVLPEDHRSVAVTKKNLGVAQFNSKQYDEAYESFEKAGDILVSKKTPRDDPELQDVEAAKNAALDVQ